MQKKKTIIKNVCVVVFLANVGGGLVVKEIVHRIYNNKKLCRLAVVTSQRVPNTIIHSVNCDITIQNNLKQNKSYLVNCYFCGFAIFPLPFLWRHSCTVTEKKLMNLLFTPNLVSQQTFILYPPYFFNLVDSQLKLIITSSFMTSRL